MGTTFVSIFITGNVHRRHGLEGGRYGQSTITYGWWVVESEEGEGRAQKRNVYVKDLLNISFGQAIE